MRGRDQARGRAHGEGQGARGAWAELGRVRPGRAGPHRGSKPMTRTTTDRNSTREAKSETKQHTRLNTTSDKIKYDSA
jgi:hypothetical protein